MNRMMTRRVAACFLALGIATTAVGVTPHLGSARAADKVNLAVWIPDYCAPDTQNFYKTVLTPAFTKAYPGISPSMVFVDWSVYDQKVGAAFAGGSAPDIMQTGAQYVPELVAKNQIRAIDSYLPAWGHKQDYYPGAWGNTVWQGRNYGVPYISGVDGLIYRKSMLKAAGISHPPMTWDELFADAVKLTKKDSKGQVTQLGFATRIGDATTWVFQWLRLYAAAGGKLVSADGKQAAINNPSGVAAAKLFVTLFQAMTPGGVGLSSKIVAPFQAGKIAMQVQQESISSDTLHDNPKILNDIGVTALPAMGAQGKRIGLAFNDWLAITTQSKNPDAAWKWITFASQPQYLSAYDRTCGAIPQLKTAASAAWITSNPIYHQFTTNVYPYSVTFPFFPHVNQMLAAIGSEIEKAAYGKETPEQAIQNGQRAATAVLSGTATH